MTFSRICPEHVLRDRHLMTCRRLVDRILTLDSQDFAGARNLEAWLSFVCRARMARAWNPACWCIAGPANPEVKPDRRMPSGVRL